jgi:DNA-binding winged helix-turn-helix (wHTH) protein
LGERLMGTRQPVFRFGVFELDLATEQLRKNGATIRLQPQPYRLLRLLVEASGRLLTREDIRAALWPGDTYVDFDQGVNFAVRQVREALGDDADRPIYVQTVPKRGYRFLPPVEAVVPGGVSIPVGTDPGLHKALWTNIFELRFAEEERRRWRKKMAVAGGATALGVLAAALLWYLFVH